MSIRDYFKPANGLPDPSGPLSRDLPSRAIATVNREVQRILAEDRGKEKRRGKYNR